MNLVGLQGLNAGMGAIGTIGGLILGAKQQHDQMKLNQDMLNYNQNVMEKTWQREDNAWRRGRRDMLAAGINPLYNNAQPVNVSGGMAWNPGLQDLSGYFNAGMDAGNTAVMNSINTASTAKEIEKKGEEIKKLQAEVERIFSDIGVNEGTIDQIRQNIKNMRADEALTWQRFLTEIENTDNVAKDTLLKIAQKELLEEQKRLTGTQIRDLRNKFEDREWYNLYERFNDAVAKVRSSDLTAQQRRNAELTMYEIINRTEKYDHDKIMDELEYELKVKGFQAETIQKIMSGIAEGAARGLKK